MMECPDCKNIMIKKPKKSQQNFPWEYLCNKCGGIYFTFGKKMVFSSGKTKKII